jgi:hypothetical protein
MELPGELVAKLLEFLEQLWLWLLALLTGSLL